MEEEQNNKEKCKGAKEQEQKSKSQSYKKIIATKGEENVYL
jgi:hypothetical protein